MRGAGGALGALDDDAPALQKVQVGGGLAAGGVEDDVQAVRVHAHQQAGDELLDDLAEGQRHDGEVVAREPQHRNADQKADDGGEEGAHDHRQRQAHRCGGDHAHEAHGGDDAGEGADAHEARVTETQVAQDAHREV